MKESKRRSAKKFLNQFNFEEIDHRLSCGWHVEVEETGQQKRYLRKIEHNSKLKPEQELSK